MARKAGTKVKKVRLTLSALKRRGIMSLSIIDNIEDWHSDGSTFKALGKSSFEADECLENIDIAIHVILDMGRLLSLAKTADVFISKFPHLRSNE